MNVLEYYETVKRNDDVSLRAISGVIELSFETKEKDCYTLRIDRNTDEHEVSFCGLTNKNKPEIRKRGREEECIKTFNEIYKKEKKR